MKLRKRCHSCVVAAKVAGCLFGCNKRERIVRQLDVLTRQANVRQETAIEEQLRKCPEAFQVGEVVEKLFQSLKEKGDEALDHDRCLPPAQAVLPPLV